MVFYLKTKTKNIKLPAFFPDATHGVVKTLDSADIINTKTKGIVVNTYHLLMNNKVDLIQASGGIHKFINFSYPIISDSGGFQAMSLVRRNGNGKLTDTGIYFKDPLNGNDLTLTPELCIESQIKLGSDVIMCLDDCTDPHESIVVQEKSVERTISWAKRCKDTFDKKFKNIKKRPLIFGIIQGGNSKKLRKYCASRLIEIGFDGYAFGGWPVQDGKFLNEIVKYTCNLMPEGKPKYAMGVGKPEDILKCIKWGYNLFDCVLPTRDARHKRLYVFSKNPESIQPGDKSYYKFLYIGSSKFKESNNNISYYCDCHTCRNYTRSFLHHLFKINETTALRLATIHNLRFYSMLLALDLWNTEFYREQTFSGSDYR